MSEEMIARRVEEVRSEENGEAAISVLRKLAVCRGGFTRAAAENIAGEADFTKVVSLLLDRELMRLDGERYEIDPVVAQTVGEDKKARRTHVQYYEALAVEANETQDYSEMNGEEANLEAAFAWSVRTGDVTWSLWFADLCANFQIQQGQISQTLAWLTQVEALVTAQTDDWTRGKLAYSWGTAYLEDSAGNRKDNLLRAITAFEQASHFFHSEEEARSYANAHIRRGYAYMDLADIEARADNLRQAAAAFEEALRFYTPELAGIYHGILQTNLGAAYGELSKIEDHAHNLRRTIVAFGQALHFYTLETDPAQYAVIQDHLGNAYFELGMSDGTVQQWQYCIASYEQALRVWTLETEPDHFAEAQSNLGVAYQLLGQSVGKKDKDNARKAIAAYQQALRVYIAQKDPNQYAQTQLNLGQAYEDSGDVTAAIQCWCEAQNCFRLVGRDQEAEIAGRWIAERGKACE